MSERPPRFYLAPNVIAFVPRIRGMRLDGGSPPPYGPDPVLSGTTILRSTVIPFPPARMPAPPKPTGRF